MTASPEPAPPHAALARRAIPDFFIVGHAKCGTTALYEMLSRHPQIFMPEAAQRSRGSSRPTIRTRASGDARSRAPAAARNARRVPVAVRRGGPDQRVGEASTFYLWSRTRRRAHRPGAARRAHHRDPARAGELPALAPPAAAAEPSRDGEGPAPGESPSRAPGARAGTFRALPLAAGADVLRARALCRAAAPLPRRVPAASRCWS